jgi:hypothetical protein
MKTKSQIKIVKTPRWKWMIDPYGDSCMARDSTGAWMKYADHEAQIRKLESIIKSTVPQNKYKALQVAGERLKKTVAKAVAVLQKAR